MVVNRKKPSVLLYGGLWASNRCEHLIEFLVSSGYYVTCIFPDFYTNQKQQRNFFAKIVRRVSFRFFSFIELFIKASFADVIYILPGNVSLINQVLLISKIFNNIIILELYDSMYTHYMDNKGAHSIAEEDIERVKPPGFSDQ